jgi:hypothetical protein
MADISDVEVALAAAITAAFYPTGTDATSTIGVPIRIHRGKVNNSDLRYDRTNGFIDIGIYALLGGGRNTTRWGVQVTELPGLPTLTVGTSSNSATFFGTASAGDLAGVLIEQQAYIYQAAAGDAAALVCAALADSIRSNMICWLTGATLTVPSVSSIVARCAHGVDAIEEWGRQEHRFCVSILAQTPALRDIAGSAVVPALAQIGFLTLADGTGGRLRYHGLVDRDGEQAASVYSRDIDYDVEFATTSTSNGPSMLFGNLAWNGTTILS